MRAVTRLLIESSRLHLKKGEGDLAITDMNVAMGYWSNMIDQDRDYIDSNIREVEQVTSGVSLTRSTFE